MNRPRLRPMRARNQPLVALWGTLLVAAVVLLATNLDALPFVHPTTGYHAQFENGNGLKSGDDVRVEGVTVGAVDAVRVDGARVDVRFHVRRGLALGDRSQASIEVATILGNLFLQLTSDGTGRMPAGATIPLARTTPAYSLLGALDQVGDFGQKTDLTTLRESLRSLAGTLDGISSADVKATLSGLSTVASTLAAKQDDITTVLGSAQRIVATLNTDSGALAALLTQGDEFLKMLIDRHRIVASLLTDTARLGSELHRLFARNGAQLSALFANLDAVTAVLAQQKGQLEQAVRSLGRFAVNITNVTGSGPWLDLLTPTTFVPDNQIKGCGADPAASRQKPCSP